MYLKFDCINFDQPTYIVLCREYVLKLGANYVLILKPRSMRGCDLISTVAGPGEGVMIQLPPWLAAIMESPYELWQ